MNRINAIIIDDESKCVEMLTLMLQHYHKDITVIDTANSMQSGLLAIEQHKDAIDLLFLDIQMPGGDGFALLQHLPEIHFKIIFTTAFDQFAIKAFKFSALDYLLKPIDYIELGLTLDKFRTMQHDARFTDFKNALKQKATFDKLAIATLSEIKFLKLEKIVYLESDNNYTTVYSDNKQRIVTSKNIGYYEELLEGNGFFRVNNSNLVNLKKIERFIKGKSGAIALEDGNVLQVSASRREKLLQLLGLS